MFIVFFVQVASMEIEPLVAVPLLGAFVTPVRITGNFVVNFAIMLKQVLQVWYVLVICLHGLFRIFTKGNNFLRPPDSFHG